MRFSKRLLGTLRDLLDLVGEDNIKEIEVEQRFPGGGRIRIVKGGEHPVYAPLHPAFAPHVEKPPAPGGQAVQPEEPVASDETDGLHSIVSPMVGVFYNASNPDLPPYVEEGDIVSPGQTLCIIEAMKIMNEVESEYSGKIVSILVENGQPVEYGEPLFNVAL